MPSTTAQLGSPGEETQHPDNSSGDRGLALKLNLGKLTAQFTWRLTILLIREFPWKETGRMSHCGPSKLIDSVILWLPIFLGIHLQRWPVPLSPQAAREEHSVQTPREQGMSGRGRKPSLSSCLSSLGDVTRRDISS